MKPRWPACLNPSVLCSSGVVQLWHGHRLLQYMSCHAMAHQLQHSSAEQQHGWGTLQVYNYHLVAALAGELWVDRLGGCRY